ncbi:MAG TPA: hypothetical protein DIU09_16015 [Hyphomonadaceae bacterium]|nr:hypothetical protein [Hyphomonadaceae bacterium]
MTPKLARLKLRCCFKVGRGEGLGHKLNAEVLPPSLRQKLQPGQPVEVHIATSNRSALSYFLKPLTDQIMRTFREE